MAKHGKPGETIRPSTVKQYLERARAKLAAAGKPTKSIPLTFRADRLGLHVALDQATSR